LNSLPLHPEDVGQADAVTCNILHNFQLVYEDLPGLYFTA